MEEEEEELVAEDKSRRAPGKGPSESAHLGEGVGGIRSLLHPKMLLRSLEVPVLSLPLTPKSAEASKLRVPIRYCMLGSRDSARSETTQTRLPTPPPSGLWGTGL